MSTTTVSLTAREILDSGNPNKVGNVCKALKVGTQLSKIKATFASMTSAAGQDITTAANKALATVSGITLRTGENLPPIGQIVTCRVTAGTAAAGARFVSDAGATPSTTVATLSDDGKTLTFEAAVTGIVVTYFPAPYGGADQAFEHAAP